MLGIAYELASLRSTKCCLCGRREHVDADVPEQGLHADAEVLLVTVDGPHGRLDRPRLEAYAGGGPRRPRAVYTGPHAMIDL